MANATLTSEQVAAKAVIQSIADSRGHLRREFYDMMTPEARQEVERILLSTHETIGAAVILIARELYTKDIRFIFELLQNADDNHYDRLANGAVPQVSFSLFKDRLVIECNEDGFNERNIRAICDVGMSSKLGGQSHGYTGEKGVGFKSVFKVAWRVHIQSGPYSFQFIHNPGDIGIGMISPEWVNPTQTLENCNTRITLDLIRDGGAAARHEAIKKQLQELQSTMLLFLRNLRRITINIYRTSIFTGAQQKAVTVMEATVDHNAHKAILQKFHRDSHGDRTEETKTLCHVTRHSVTGLPRSQNREYSKTEEMNKSDSTAEVILAFPITEDSTPLVEAQEVYAFLPLKRLGFNFLIHTDFVTVANREDVREDSPRNLHLLDAIAEAFIKAIHQMWDRPPLRYQWMRYLRDLKRYPWTTFWQKLVNRIGDKLSDAAVLEAGQGDRPRLLRELKRLSNSYVDDDGEPLFPDFPGDAQKYLSTQYLDLDLDILSDYGLRYMHHKTWLEYVKHDLNLPSTDSRLKSAETSNDWHTKTASSLALSFSKSWQASIQYTQQLKILPLFHGKWSSAMDGDFFFPSTESCVKIPEYVNLDILSAAATANPARAKLYSHLGATYPNDAQIRSHIIDFYRNCDRCSDLSKSYAYLVFLYETHQPKLTASYEHVHVQTTTSGAWGIRPRKRDVYLASEDPYSSWQLSQQGDSKWFKDNVEFLDPKYLNTPHPSSQTTDLPWIKWLTQLGIRNRPRLVAADESSLSPLCLHIAANQPSRFLNFVKYSWPDAWRSFKGNEIVQNAMSVIDVPCKNSNDLYPLAGTYLPLVSLQEKCRDLMGDVFFPFLDLGKDLSTNEDASCWDFLSRFFGVGAQDDIRFYIDILDWMQAASVERQFNNPEAVVKVYENLYIRCREEKDKAARKALVRETIDEKDLIFVPQLNNEHSSWTYIENCRLDAPADLEYCQPLLARYQAVLPSLGMLESFFSDVLEVQSFSWEDIVEELKYMRDVSDSNFDKILSYYNLLGDTERWLNEGMNTDTLRELFQAGSLVFIYDKGQGKWVEPSECLWSTATEIRGKIMLNDYYDENMGDFFVHLIGVSRLTAQMVYDQLTQVKVTTHNVRQVKELWTQFNALLEDEHIEGSPKALMKKAIFPTRNPDASVVLCSFTDEFAIVDRRLLGEQFQDKIKLLDFSLNEAHNLQPLLRWMDLEKRYLSRLVKEHTFVDNKSTYPLRDTTRLISRKAHALTRLAVHSRSPRTRNPSDTQFFYDLLRNSKMWETDKICLALTVNQNNTPHLANEQESEVHITDSTGVLKIYVPRDEVSQEVCFASTLPKALVHYMTTNPVSSHTEGQPGETLSQMVTSIIGAKSAAGMRQILENEGIVDIEIAEPSQEEAQQIEEDSATTGFQALPYRSRVPTISDEPESSQAGPNTPTTDSTPVSGDPFSGSDSATLHRLRIPLEREETGDDLIADNTLVEHYPLGATPYESSQPRQLHYSTLLEHIIRAGRGCEIPLQGRKTSSLTATESTHHTLPSNHSYPGDWLDRECVSSFDRDCKLGAAGELFTFELLKSALDDFDYTCWQSTMRRHVSGPGGHAEYADMGPWNSAGQREISDIVYNDAKGKFIRLLVDGEYLDRETWSGRKGVRCYVEVKSTFQQCEAPFFISEPQYKKMSECMTDTSIYMIVRVFDLGSRSVGAKIYMDPDKLRREGHLRFSGKKWVVTPMQG